MEHSFYLPIQATSLSHYFGKGIILPSKYITNKPNDIQDHYPGSILISKVKWVEKSNCSIEIVLTDLEIKNLKVISENFLLASIPFPISRIRTVYFTSKERLATTTFDINNGAAFIPNSITYYERVNENETISESELKIDDINDTNLDYNEKINQFDKILGGLAFMRNSGKTFMNYSENYFTTLSHFNSIIKKHVSTAVENKKLNFDDKYTGLFSSKNSEWSKWHTYIKNKNLTIEEIKNLAKQEDITVVIKYGNLDLNSLNTNSHLYELAVVAIYGDGKSKSTHDLVNALFNGSIRPEKTEDVSIVFGLINGYSKLINSYKCSEKEFITKFKLESKLDYYTIESIYQYIFNSPTEISTFPYLDDWCPTSSLNMNLKGYESYRILDTTVIAKKKKTPSEIFLQNYSVGIYSKINKAISGWFPSFVHIDENKAIKFFENELMDILNHSVQEFQKNLDIENALNDDLFKQNISEIHKKEIEILQIEISKLRAENDELKLNLKEIPVIKNVATSIDNTVIEKFTDNRESKIANNQDIEDKSVFRDTLSNSSVQDLKNKAKSMFIKNYNTMKKAELIESIISTPVQGKLL